MKTLYIIYILNLNYFDILFVNNKIVKNGANKQVHGHKNNKQKSKTLYYVHYYNFYIVTQCSYYYICFKINMKCSLKLHVWMNKIISRIIIIIIFIVKQLKNCHFQTIIYPM